MPDDAPVKDDRAPWWPVLPLIPAIAALFVAVEGLGNARPYIQANPCATGWDVPWAGLFATLQTVGIVTALASLLIAYSIRGTNTRIVAIVALIVGIVVWIVALVLHAGPYGWHCWRAF